MPRKLIARRPIQPDHVLSSQVMAAQRPGIASTASIQSAALASSVAMHHATMLSRSADAAFRVSPMGEDTYRSILTAFGAVAVSEIQALGFRDGVA